MSGGGTDSGSIHLTANGVPALSITVATRYIHSHAAILHRDDFENAVKLIVETIKKLDHDKVKDIRLAYSGCSESAVKMTCGEWSFKSLTTWLCRIRRHSRH